MTEFRARHRALFIRAAFVALLGALAACSSTKRPSAAGAGPPQRTASAGGGYYLDDGPGERSAAEVQAIADAVPRAEPILLRTSRPYSVFGRVYTPMRELVAYRERGMASWYGKRYHGKPTSSGEPYDMYAMTAAHPTLPIPSYVRVTRTATGRSVVVRVNDRGPFLQNRIIDLSYTAAAKLGFVQAGSAEVEVETITAFDAPAEPTLVAAASAPPAAASAPPVTSAPPAADTRTQRVVDVAPKVGTDPQPVLEPALLVETNAPPVSTRAQPLSTRAADLRTADVAAPASAASSATVAPMTAPAFWLQFGAFASERGAQAALDELRRDLSWLDARFAVAREGPLYKVRAGPWAQREHAIDVADRVRRSTSLQPFAVFR